MSLRLPPVNRWTGLPVAGILLIALLVRFRGLDFGLPALLDPDELMFQLGAYRMIDSGVGNPGWFGHPATSTMYVLVLVMVGTFVTYLLTAEQGGVDGFVAAIFDNPGLVVFPGRVAMVVFALISVFLLYRLGRRLFDRSTGLLAAAIIALSPVHITWSQVIRTDIMATAFFIAVMLFALRYMRSGRLRDLVLASVLTGLAIATKWPFAVAILSIIGAETVRLFERGGDPVQALRRLVLAAAITVGTLFLVSPYLLFDYPTVLQNLRGEAQLHHIGANGGGFFHNIAFYMTGPLLAALGLPGLAAALAGLVPRRSVRDLLIIAGPPSLAMLVVMCMQNLVWERWAIPLIPLLALSAAHLVMQVWRRRLAILPIWPRVVSACVLLAILFVPLATEIRGRHAERTLDNRRLASDWVRANVPAGSVVLIEHFAFDLRTDPVKLVFPVGTAGCLGVDDLLGGRVDNRFIEGSRGGNANLDLSAVPEESLESCQAADYAILTEYGRYMAEEDEYPEEAERYRRFIAASEVLRVFRAEPGKIGGRPEVMVVRFTKPITAPGAGD